MKTAEKLLQMCVNHMSERETYEEAISTDDLISEIQNYLSTSHPTTLPSDEEIENWKHSVSDVYGAEMSNHQTPEGFLTWELGMKQMRSLCEAKMAEMEREIENLKDDIILLQVQLLSKD